MSQVSVTTVKLLKCKKQTNFFSIHLFQLRSLKRRMMHDAWSMFHSPQCIIVASLVNYVPAMSLDTWKANATDASILCQQNVKTMYFKTLNPRLFNLRQWLEVRFFSVVICKCCKFSMSLLGSCAWEFWMELKKIKFKVFVELQ